MPSDFIALVKVHGSNFFVFRLFIFILLQLAAIEKKPSRVKWDLYASPIIKKCRSLDNVQMYIDNSLSIALKPVPSHLEREPVKVKLKHSMSSLQLSSDKHPVIKEAKEITEEHVDNDKDSFENAQKNDDKENQSVDSKVKPNKQLPLLKELNGNPEVRTVNNDEDTSLSVVENGESNKVNPENQDIEDSDDKNNVDNIKGLLETSSEAFSETASTSDDISYVKVGEKPPPAPRFGYTNANISLGGVRRSYHDQENDDSINNRHHRKSNNSNSSSSHRKSINGVVEIETVAPLEQQQKTGSERPLTIRLSNRSLHTTNLTNIPLVPGYVRPRSGKVRKERVLTSKSDSNIVDNADEEYLEIRKKSKCNNHYLV